MSLVCQVSLSMLKFLACLLIIILHPFSYLFLFYFQNISYFLFWLHGCLGGLCT